MSSSSSRCVVLLAAAVMMMACVCVCVCERGVVHIALTHSLSRTRSTTTNELIKARVIQKRERHVSVGLSSGSDYTMSVKVAGQQVWLYMDTGSDLVWFPCQPFECIMCEGESVPPNPPPIVPNSTAVSCDSPWCRAAHSAASSSSSDLCAAAGCPLDAIEMSECGSFECPAFYYAYADGSLVGRLHTHPVAASPSLLIPNFTFGCAHTTLAEPIGVAGFGRGPLSMTAQLAPMQAFSYCLVSHSFDRNRARRPSPLILGRRHGVSDFQYTAMLDNPKKPYLYSVALLGIAVGNTTVEAPHFLRRVDSQGRGGMVVDSGTTFTMLPATMYEGVVAEFERHIVVGGRRERSGETEETTGLGPCYYYHGTAKIEVPPLRLVFAGNAVELPRRNYMYQSGRVACLTLVNGGLDQDAAILGSYQQQGFEVVYDLENRRIGFANRKCSLLWDSLNNP